MRRSLEAVRIPAVAGLVGVVALLLRKFLVEPDHIGQLCSGAAAPAWCLVRHAVVLGFVHNVYGWVSVAAAVLALLLRAAPRTQSAGLRVRYAGLLGWFALASGVLGCVLYRFDPAGAGVLLAALVLARLRNPADQQRDRQQQA